VREERFGVASLKAKLGAARKFKKCWMRIVEVFGKSDLLDAMQIFAFVSLLVDPRHYANVCDFVLLVLASKIPAFIP
jgi:hypothetical protein